MPKEMSIATETAAPTKSVCKLLLCGPPKTGKSSLLQSFNGLDFDESYKPTTTSDFSVKDMKCLNVDVCLQVWDIGGSSMGRSFVRGSNAVVLVVDLTSAASMSGIDEVYNKVKKFAGFPDDNFPCILVGSKLDLVQQPKSESSSSLSPSSSTTSSSSSVSSTSTVKREVTLEMMRQWAKQRRLSTSNKITCIEVSAKTKVGVQEMFMKAVDIFLRKPGGAGNSNFQPSVSSVVDTNESMSVGSRSSSCLDETTEDIPIAKIVLAGPPSVGKTCMLTRFITNDVDIPTKHEPTIGADFRVSEMQVNDITLTLQIWDTAGDKKMLSIGKSLYRNADGIILVYDISSRASFKQLDTYWENFLKYSGIDESEFFPAALVGNKSDMSAKRDVSLEEVIDWCTNKRPQKQITYLECSAKLDIGVKDVFNFITHAHYDYVLSGHDSWTETDFDDTETEYEDEAFEPSEVGLFQNGADGRVSDDKGKGRNKTPKTDEEKSCWCKLY